MSSYAFYCAKCWQEFDEPKDHELGSWVWGNHGRERLDVKCAGDIKPTNSAAYRKGKFKRQAEALDLNSIRAERIAEYQSKYQRQHYAVGRRLRAEWIAANGPCKRCGSSEYLQIDHVDSQSKTITAHAIWVVSAKRRAEELAKCQVLCRRCHSSKSSSEDRPKTVTHCRNGHEYTPENTGRHTANRRRCLTCKKEWGLRKRMPAGSMVRASTFGVSREVSL